MNCSKAISRFKIFFKRIRLKRKLLSKSKRNNQTQVRNKQYFYNNKNIQKEVVQYLYMKDGWILAFAGMERLL